MNPRTKPKSKKSRPKTNDQFKELRALIANAADQVDPDHPYLVGTNGDVEFSTSTYLAPLPGWIADVNGYYRALGVDPKATRKELGQGYLAVGGQDSIWLTYVLSQLLDADTRRAYDLMPLGKVFPDRFILEELRRKISVAEGEINLIKARAGIDEEAHQHILEMMGLKDDDDEEPVPLSWKHENDPAFPYNYYLWHSKASDGRRLAKWQTLIITALAKADYRTKLAVGFCGKVPQNWLVSMVGFRTVVFLNEEALPTTQFATEAAKLITQQ